MAKIRAVVTEGNRQSGCKRIQVLFGTNYFLDIGGRRVRSRQTSGSGGTRT